MYDSMVPLASTLTTLSSSAIFSFNPLRARSLTSWYGDTSAATCLDHYDDIFDDMLCVIDNLRNMWRSIIAVIQPSLVLYMSLHVLSG